MKTFSQKDINRLLMLTVCAFAILFVGGLATTYISAKHSDDDIYAAQIGGCERLNKVIKDYEQQYGEIYEAAVTAHNIDPSDVLASQVIAAFGRFNAVNTIDCVKAIKKD